MFKAEGETPFTWGYTCRVQAAAKFSPCFLVELCVHPDEAPSKLPKAACPGRGWGDGEAAYAFTSGEELGLSCMGTDSSARKAIVSDGVLRW